MHARASRIASFIVPVVAIAAATPGASARPGGEGGTIYFINGGGPTNYTWSMNSDGSQVTQLGWWGVLTYPSRLPHNSHRWFLTCRPIPNAYYPDGVTIQSAVFAYRDDASTSIPGTIVQLTDPAAVEPSFIHFYGMQWLTADQGVSFKGRHWSGLTIDQGGLYTAALAYDASGNIIGLTAQPTAPTVAFPLDANAWPVVNTHTWSPDGGRVAYTDNSVAGIWVADLAANTRTQIYSTTCTNLDWSPAGTKIVFDLGGVSIATINPDGTGVRQVIGPTRLHGTNWTGFGHSSFSPSGNSIVCVGFTPDRGGQDDVFRATSTGGLLTNVTNTGYPNNELPIAWR